jgi:hypothetical protein
MDDDGTDGGRATGSLYLAGAVYAHVLATVKEQLIVNSE